ncbi:MAG: uracil-DNA glycosylase [Alphaproteobacteria bacterium]|nr:uracil-DNA glycosylase [Alphaproteobacteria bacterium]
MTEFASENTDPATLLAWHVAMGADEAVDDDPIDRFTAEPPPPAAVVPQQKPAVAKPPQGPRPVAAKPVQAVVGAGPEAAARVAAEAQTLADLKTAMEAFDGGLLKRSAKNTVFADGTEGAPLMVIGEAPGADEDQQGKPFVGVSGQLLDRILNAAGFAREENVYITNMVPWRPLGNATPDAATIAMCMPFVKRHIELSKPKVILMVGGVSAKALLDTEDGITRLRGRWKELDIGGQKIAALPVYHPAYLLRQPALKGHAWRDILSAKRKLASL